MEPSEVRYAKSGDVHVAYRVWGDGPFDVVVVPPLTFAMEVHGNAPDALAAFARLARIARVIQFDKRGIGSSDPVAGAPSLEARMDDARAVMDAVGSSVAAFVGIADGGPMSVLLAATYPERVFGLALFRLRPRHVRSADFPWAPSREEYEQHTEDGVRRVQLPERARFELYKKTQAAWGLETPPWPDFRELMRGDRLAASPGSLAALRRLNAEIDVRPVLRAVQAPTLLMYRAKVSSDLLMDAMETDDAALQAYVAEKIPQSRTVELSPVGWWHEVMLEPLERFLPEAWAEWQRREHEPQRVLATVLFTDLVASTSRAVELGPRWQDLLAAHNAAVRRELAHFQGREIDTAGDGFFASGFDGPARAIRCACAIRNEVTALGLGVRVGVHTGECDLVDGKLAGLAVSIGARVVQQADEGEVVVSATVRDLVAGSGILFESRGIRELKGLGEWPLYAVQGMRPENAFDS